MVTQIKESVFAKLFIVYCIAAALILIALEATEDYFSQHPSETAAALSLFFLLVLILTFVLTRRILKPLKDLQKAVLEIASGNFDFKLEAVSNDEFGKIEKSFNLMSQEVKKRVKASQQLLLDVSHEFRTPLNRIGIALELGPEERESIRNSLQELESMIAELLESARLDDSNGVIKKLPEDIARLLAELCNQYEARGPGVIFTADQESVLCDIDARRFRIAVKNILENAVKYSAGQTRPVEVKLSSEADSTEILIEDFGQGIAFKDQGFIFEPFYRADYSRARLADESVGGYGLGLSLAKKIVLAHNGKITFRSEPGKGTTFSITINHAQTTAGNLL